MDSMDSDDLDTPTLALMLAARLRDRVCESPVSTLAGAVTVGYVLGWSLPTPLYRTLASLGLRAVVMQVVTRVLGSDDDDDYGGRAELEDDDGLDLSGGMPAEPRTSDVPPYVA